MMVFIELHRLAEVQDRQQREDERLDRADEQVEALPDRVGQPQDPRREQRDQRDQDAAGEHVAKESERQRDRLGQLLDEVDRREECYVALQQLHGVPDDAAAPDACRVVADEYEQGERQYEVDVACRRLEQLVGGAGSVGVLHRQHREPVRNKNEHEQRDGQWQYEGGDLHADRGLDLIAQLDRDGFPEQLYAAGHTGRCDLGAQEECQRDHDHRGDRGRQHRVGVDGQPEPLRGLVMTDLDRGFGEERHGSRRVGDIDCGHCCVASPSSPPVLVEPTARIFFITGSAVEITSTTWNSAMPNTTPSPCGRKMNAIVSPITVIINRRVAEFSAILRLSGCASAVMASTDRCTSTALSKPSPRPTPKKTPIITWPSSPAASVARPVSTTQTANRRNGLKATDGNTNGASCAGVVTASPQSRGHELLSRSSCESRHE